MRGLPPWPSDFLLLRGTVDVNGSEVTFDQTISAPGADIANPSELETIAGAWFLTCWPDLLPLLPTAASLSVLRLANAGSLRTTIVYEPADNHGAYGTCQSLNTAVCLTWRTAIPGYTARSHTRLPVPIEHVDNAKRLLQPVYWSQAQAAARDYVGHVNAIPSPNGSACQLSVVSRVSGGHPRPASAFAPVTLGDACRHVATLQARTRVAR